ncbi:IclR family transcriptional regulator [uncultured Jatrophihabitans sp.]|uniref:IclR family transcriptional regulator n=1 Tax=uncultured Jatrophihabitans sp. TaxID=1610747 RepID=UPI0035CC73E9
MTSEVEGRVHRVAAPAGHSGGDVAEAGRDQGSEDGRQGIQSVEIAMTVLLTLEDGGGPMSLTQLSTASGMQPSKVHRYLVSLSRVGLVAQSPTSGRYDLGPSLRRLGADALRRMDEVGIASDHLPGLRDRTGHAVNLAVWGDHGPVIVRWDYGAYALPITVRVGSTLPLLTSSVGRVYLTYLPATLTWPVLRAQGPDVARADPAVVEEITATVRRDGFATTAGAVIPGIYSVAAPVFTTGDQLPLVVSIALPERLANAALLQSVTATLLETTSAMSADIGYTGPMKLETRSSR